MIDGRKNSLKYSYPWFLWLLVIITNSASANYPVPGNFEKALTAFQDTVPIRKTQDSLAAASDTTIKVTDTFNVRLSKDSLDSPVSYSASDSMVLEIPTKQIILFTNANVKKEDMDLSADSIIIDQPTKLVTATYRVDTTGRRVGKPKMIQGESTMESDFIRYNFETQKGLTQNTVTQQGEIYIQGEKVKKVNETDFFAYRGQFTTCNLDTPHFAFRTKKLKLVNQKLAISGPVHPEFEGVPVPIYLPFGFFPISQGRHSGLLPPTFTASEQFGLGLLGLGYYKVLNDNFDVTIRSDLYSYGGWTLYLSPTYRKRYRYNGAMNLVLQRTRILSSDPKKEFESYQNFNISWSHSMDSKARPGTSFTANVNAGSTQFNKYVTNNPIRNFSNKLTSSITYSKNWDAKYNLTLSANHNQDNLTRLVNINLPNVAFTANTFYPLQKKEFAGTPKWYEKLGIGLTSNIVNQISFYDSLFSFSNLLDTMQWGAQHNIPIQLALPSLGPVQVAPGVSYSERWYSQQVRYSWNDSIKNLDTSITKGFFTAREMSFSLSLSTALFGTYDRFGPKSRVMAIRHVVRPSIALSYKPDFSSGDYYRTQINDDGIVGEFSVYDNNIYGPYGKGKFGGLSFGIDNNVEMKVRSKKDTTETGIKKIRLIDGFSINSAYNLMADSFHLSQIRLSLRSSILEKINITAGATLDPYQTNAFGQRIDKYVWQGGSGFSLGRLVSGNVAISTTFRSEKRENGKAATDADMELESDLPPMTMEEQLSQLEYVRQNPGEFADFNIPWSLNLSYALSFYRTLKPDRSGFETRVNSNVSWNGDFNLTPKWKVGMNGFYDIKTSAIQTLTMYLSRELHCWQLTVNVTPVGLYRSFNITINPKAGLLRDLRVNRTRYFYGS